MSILIILHDCVALPCLEVTFPKLKPFHNKVRNLRTKQVTSTISFIPRLLFKIFELIHLFFGEGSGAYISMVFCDNLLYYDLSSIKGCPSLSRTRKGPENLFEIEGVRDREREK